MMPARIDGTPTFGWTERYSVNIKTLDIQHQDLFATIEELNASLAAGQGATAMDDVLRKLVEYSITHFATEETLMQEHNFPGLPTHQVEHEAFKRNVAKYMEDFQAEKVGSPVSLLLFLQSWLKEHILKSDKAYSAFLNKRGVH